MTIKTCTCGNPVTTRTAIIKGRTELNGRMTLWFNCPKCGSTMIVMAKQSRKVV